MAYSSNDTHLSEEVVWYSSRNSAGPAHRQIDEPFRATYTLKFDSIAVFDRMRNIHQGILSILVVMDWYLKVSRAVPTTKVIAQATG